MDHRHVISSLLSSQRKHLLARSNTKGLLHLFFHWGAIVILGILIAGGAPLWPLIMVFQGILLVFLFTLVHETVHRTPFRTLWLNQVVSFICGFLIILPVGWFRLFHFEHHRYTHVPGKDPELEERKPENIREFIAMISGLLVWRSHVATLFRNAFGVINDDYVPEQAVAGCRREARIMWVLYAILILLSVVMNSAILLYVWIVPMLLGQPFLRVYLMAEHTGCAHEENMFVNTRTIFTNSLIRKLSWNMPYHTAHHCYPGVLFLTFLNCMR